MILSASSLRYVSFGQMLKKVLEVVGTYSSIWKIPYLISSNKEPSNPMNLESAWKILQQVNLFFDVQLQAVNSFFSTKAPQNRNQTTNPHLE